MWLPASYHEDGGTIFLGSYLQNYTESFYPSFNDAVAKLYSLE
jgi:hypothetical protein